MHANTGFSPIGARTTASSLSSTPARTTASVSRGASTARIGVARSRDLVHWRLPGDLRD
jgi:hypothetical protein